MSIDMDSQQSVENIISALGRIEEIIVAIHSDTQGIYERIDEMALAAAIRYDSKRLDITDIEMLIRRRVWDDENGRYANIAACRQVSEGEIRVALEFYDSSKHEMVAYKSDGTRLFTKRPQS